MVEFVLNNNMFRFNSKAYQQKWDTTIGIKFAPTFACIYLDQAERKFLETQIKKNTYQVKNIDDIFFI